MKPQILDNPMWRNRVGNVLVTNPGRSMGVGIRVYNTKENAVVIYPRLGFLMSKENSLEDYLNLEWFDTHDEGRTFIPCDSPTIRKFLEDIAQNG